MNVLISDNLAEIGIETLRKAGLEVDVKTGLLPEELKKIIGAYDALVIRSATQVTREIIEAGTKLRVVGRAGIGLDNVDIPVASKAGVVVMNAPEGNATTAAEHAISMMMSLSRNIPQATASMKAGKWEKKKFMGRELTGKTLGIVGIGRIGAIVADRAQGLKMSVVAFDPYLSEEQAKKIGVTMLSLDELAARADYISVHTPLLPETRHMLSTDFFSKMKNDAMLIDCARGGVVDEEALYHALKDGTIAGAALDVFEKEPTTLEGTPLLGLDNFICTPHLGASTSEAQENVAEVIARQVADYLKTGVVCNAVNVPSVSGDVLRQVGPYITLGEMLGSFHMQIAQGGIKDVQLEYLGDLAGLDITPITVAFLKGLFAPILRDAVNFVNAPFIAKERGIKVTETKTDESTDYTSVFTARVKTADGENCLTGTVFGKSEPRLVRINDFWLEALPAGTMLFVNNHDIPGVIGALGSTLGACGINISRMTVGREKSRKRNVILMNIDTRISKEDLQQVRALEHIDDAMVLELPHHELLQD